MKAGVTQVIDGAEYVSVASSMRGNPCAGCVAYPSNAAVGLCAELGDCEGVIWVESATLQTGPTVPTITKLPRERGSTEKFQLQISRLKFEIEVDLVLNELIGIRKVTE